MSLLPRLRVSQNRRFLSTENGKPFFYLGDTVWELFHRYDRSEAEIYLRDRAAKGFTVVQAVILAEFDGLTVPNRNGDLPLNNLDPLQLNGDYLDYVAEIIRLANSLGIYVGLLPTWGDKWNKMWGAGPEVFTAENARPFGSALGERFRDDGIIWILGGDRPIQDDLQRSILDAMAAGIRDAVGNRQLITFHPPGPHGSSEFVADADWLDFHMWQSGHDRNTENWKKIASDYEREPTKPTLDGEPGYEEHPASFRFENGYLDHYDNRKAAYWSLFSGACGHTYGCHSIWQKLSPALKPVSWARTEWREALQLPGAAQMRHARALIESRPYFTRVPDEQLIVGGQGEGGRHCVASRDRDGNYAFVYAPWPATLTIDLEHLSGDSLRAFWFDPRTGASTHFDTFPRSGRREFEFPAAGPDWVLVLENSETHYPRPGGAVFGETEL